MLEKSTKNTETDKYKTYNQDSKVIKTVDGLIVNILWSKIITNEQ